MDSAKNATLFSQPEAYLEFQKVYTEKTNQELVLLAKQYGQLVPEAAFALDTVLRNRGLDTPEAREPWLAHNEAEESPIANIGSMGARWLAFSIDGVFVGVLGLLIIWSASRFGRRVPDFYRGELVWGLLYFIGFEWIIHTTPGKYALGLEVRSTFEGEEHPDLLHICLRETLGRWLSSFLMLGYLSAIQNPRKQAWSDKLAFTIVVKRATEPFLRWAIRIVAVLASVEVFHLLPNI